MIRLYDEDCDCASSSPSPTVEKCSLFYSVCICSLLMDGWIEGWMDGWMDGGMDGCGWMHGWRDDKTIRYSAIFGRIIRPNTEYSVEYYSAELFGIRHVFLPNIRYSAE